MGTSVKIHNIGESQSEDGEKPLRLAEGFVVNEWLIEAACWYSCRATQSALVY